MIRKVLLGSALLMVVVVALYVRFHHSTPPLETAYAGSRTVTLYSTSAQVREPVATVSFGDRLEVLQRFQNQVKVRTAAGVVGWIEENDLLSADLWETLKDLEAKSATMPVVARGHTRVLSNLHIEPGRDSPRVRQLNKDIPLDMMARQPKLVVPASISNAEAESADEAPAPDDRKSNGKRDTKAGEKPDTKPEPKKEDWWLVRAHMPDQTILAGWLLGRFVELDIPSPLPGLCHFRRNADRGLDGAEPRRIRVGKTHAAISSPRHARARRSTLRFHRTPRVHLGQAEEPLRNRLRRKQCLRQVPRAKIAGGRPRRRPHL